MTDVYLLSSTYTAEGLNEVKYSAYRMAMKLRLVQKATGCELGLDLLELHRHLSRVLRTSVPAVYR